MATVEPEELKKKTKMVAYDTLSEISQIVTNQTNQKKIKRFVGFLAADDKIFSTFTGRTNGC